MHEKGDNGMYERTFQCPLFIVFVVDSAQRTAGIEQGTVDIEQGALATWRRIPASGSTSKPDQKFTP